jgi:hypothetical protein
MQGEKYWKAIEPIWKAISIYDGPELFLAQYQKVPPALGHLFAAHWCRSEVYNGGFHQFFTNWTGVLAPEAVEGFRAIGLDDCATVIEEAMKFFGNVYPRDRHQRCEVLASIPGRTREEWDPFYQLDERFYDLIDLENGGFDEAADKYASRGIAY